MSDRQDPGDGEWEYESPKITVLGSLAALTLGNHRNTTDTGSVST